MSWHQLEKFRSQHHPDFTCSGSNVQLHNFGGYFISDWIYLMRLPLLPPSRHKCCAISSVNMGSQRRWSPINYLSWLCISPVAIGLILSFREFALRYLAVDPTDKSRVDSVEVVREEQLPIGRDISFRGGVTAQNEQDVIGNVHSKCRCVARFRATLASRLQSDIKSMCSALHRVHFINASLSAVLSHQLHWR